MTHREAAACDSRGGDNLKIVLGLEVADFQLAQADNGERRRLDPADADHPANPGASNVFVAVRVRERLKIWSAC